MSFEINLFSNTKRERLEKDVRTVDTRNTTPPFRGVEETGMSGLRDGSYPKSFRVLWVRNKEFVIWIYIIYKDLQIEVENDFKIWELKVSW